MLNVESRKIFVVGKRSLAITLPKKWVQQHGLGIGDVVELLMNSDGSITLRPIKKRTAPPRPSEGVVDAHSVPPEHLREAITSFYINGYDSVKVVGTEGMEGVMSDLTQSLVGTIVTETPEGYVLKFLISDDKVSVDEIMSRMGAVLKSMLELYIEYLWSGNTELLGRVLALEEEVDRLYRLGMRILMSSLARAYSEGAYSDIKKLVYRLIGLKIVEDLADALDRSVRAIMRLGNEDLGPEYRELFQEVTKLAIDSYAAFRDEDAQRGFKVLRRRVEIKARVLQLKGRARELLQILLSELEIMMTFSGDLAELAIVLGAASQ